MKCQFCSTDNDVAEFNENTVGRPHLIVTTTDEGHFHVHGPVTNKLTIIEMVNVICREAGIIGFEQSLGQSSTKGRN